MIPMVLTWSETADECNWTLMRDYDTGATFAPERVHSGSLSWLYICLHDATTECHASPRRTGGSSPRLLYRGEKFTPVRNLAQRYHVNVKRPRVSVWNRPVDWNKKRMRNVCNFQSRLYFYQHEVYLQIARYEMTQSSCKRDTKSKSSRYETHAGASFLM